MMRNLFPKFLLILTIFQVTVQGTAWAGTCPSRSFSYDAGSIIEPAEVTKNEDNIYDHLCGGVSLYETGSVDAAAIKDGSITNTEIASATITAAELAANSVESSEIAANAVGTSEIATDGVGEAEIAASAVTASELAATLTMSDGDFLDFSASNASSTSDGIRLPQATSCTSATAEGQICWDTDGNELVVGDASGVKIIGPGQFALGTITRVNTADDGTVAETGVGFQPSAVYFIMVVDQANRWSSGFDDATTALSIYDNSGVTATSHATDANDSIHGQEAAGVDASAEIDSMDSDGFTLNWVKTGAVDGSTFTINYIAIR